MLTIKILHVTADTIYGQHKYTDQFSFPIRIRSEDWVQLAKTQGCRHFAYLTQHDESEEPETTTTDNMVVICDKEGNNTQCLELVTFPSVKN